MLMIKWIIKWILYTVCFHPVHTEVCLSWLYVQLLYIGSLLKRQQLCRGGQMHSEEMLSAQEKGWRDQLTGQWVNLKMDPQGLIS